MTTRRLSLTVTLALATILAGCGTSPPTRFYTVDTLPPSAETVYAGPPVRVDEVKIPSVLDRPEIVNEYAAGQLKVDDFNHWGAPLGQLLRASLAADLAARAPAVIPAQGPKPAGTVGLSVDILSVGTGGQGMTMDVVWTETRPTDDAKPQSRPMTIPHGTRLSAPDSAAAPSGYAAGLSRMMGDLADRMVAEIAATPR